MRLDDINIKPGLNLTDIEFHEKGHMVGYIECLLDDTIDDDTLDELEREMCTGPYYTLFRVRDKEGGPDNKIVRCSAPFWSDSEEAEKVLTKLVEELYLDYKAIEQAQREYKHTYN